MHSVKNIRQSCSHSTVSSWHDTIVIWREVITELSVMKIYLNSHKQRLGVTFLSARLLSLGTLPPSRGRPSCLGPHSPSSLKTFLFHQLVLFNFHAQFQVLLLSIECPVLYHLQINVINLFIVEYLIINQTNLYFTIFFRIKVSTYYLNRCRPQFLQVFHLWMTVRDVCVNESDDTSIETLLDEIITRLSYRT